MRVTDDTLLTFQQFPLLTKTLWSIFSVSARRFLNVVTSRERRLFVRSAVKLWPNGCCLLPQTDGLPDSLGHEKKVKGRTGWPQQVWALELNQWDRPRSSRLLVPEPSPETLDWTQIKTTDRHRHARAMTPEGPGVSGGESRPLLLARFPSGHTNLAVGVWYLWYFCFFLAPPSTVDQMWPRCQKPLSPLKTRLSGAETAKSVTRNNKYSKSGGKNTRNIRNDFFY